MFSNKTSITDVLQAEFADDSKMQDLQRAFLDPLLYFPTRLQLETLDESRVQVEAT